MAASLVMEAGVIAARMDGSWVTGVAFKILEIVCRALLRMTSTFFTWFYNSKQGKVLRS